MYRYWFVLTVILLMTLGAISTWACEPPGGGVERPEAGATISGTTDITLTVNSETTITSVDVLVDGSVVATLTPDSDSATTAAFTYSWDTTKVSDGAHTISATAHATDRADGALPEVKVTVTNKTATD